MDGNEEIVLLQEHRNQRDDNNKREESERQRNKERKTERWIVSTLGSSTGIFSLGPLMEGCVYFYYD